jgi:hypothetical protein
MRIGNWTLVLTFLGGIWLLVAPSLTGFPHPAGNPWPTPVLVMTLAGAFTSLASLVGLVAFAGLSLKEREAAAKKAAEAARGTR